MKRVLYICYCVSFIAAGNVQAESPETRADRILAKAGFTGGVIVYLNARDGALASALARSPRARVHGLSPNRRDIETARRVIQERGDYGKISVEYFASSELPYVDNLVNLVYCEGIPPVSEKEIMRVLRPLGVALINGEKLVKPWPDAIDEWTHYLHGPDNNAVARDRTVGIPRSLQWVSKPKWGRSHEQMASMSVAVSARGRFFTIVDEAPLASVRYPADWKLVARDAFNGILLWKRDIAQWIDHLRHFRSGPVHLPRRLVAAGDRVYVTLGLAGSVLALDAATGETIHAYKGTEHTEEILVQDDVLYLVIGTSEIERRGGGLKSRGEPNATPFRDILAVEANTGKTIWKKRFEAPEYLLPSTLAVKGKKVAYQSTFGVVCLNGDSGETIWKSPRPTPNRRMGFSAPTLVVTADVILCADRDIVAGKDSASGAASGPPVWGVNGWNQAGFPRKGKSTLKAYSAVDGKQLWSVSCAEGYNSPVDLFVVKDMVWVGMQFNGYDLRTGVLKKEMKTRGNQVSMPHHRCYRNKATEDFIFTGWSGIEVVSLDRGWLGNNSWVRGTCQYGIMPGNGFLYAPPDACACNPAVKMPGFVSLAPQRGETGRIAFPETPVLLKGAAYGRPVERAVPDSQEWPMYRRDSDRSGSVKTKLPERIQKKWSAAIGGRLTQPVSVNGLVFVASIDAHAVYGLDAEDGKERWQYTTGGRVDSAPTWSHGRLYFGSADGSITCVQADDGELVWRFQAAPRDRRVGVYGQLESVWPVHGSILIQNDTLYATAGRSTYLDGGIVMYRLDPITGKQISRNVVYHIDPETDEQTGVEKARSFNMEGTLSDVLSGDGDAVFMKEMCFDALGRPMSETRPHLFSITGLLGEEWFVRSYWMMGTAAGSGWGRWAAGANRSPSGRILCFDANTLYGYGRKTIASGATGHSADQYHLFGVKRKPTPPNSEKPQTRRTGKPLPKIDYDWSVPGTIHVRAMALTEDQMVIAGPVDVGEKSTGELSFRNEDRALSAFQGAEGSLLQIVSRKDGKPRSEISLDSGPVFDGIAVSKQKIFVSLKNGTIVSYGEE